MTIRMTCQCGKHLTAPDSAVGKTGRCPACRRLVTVPGSRAQVPGRKGREGAHARPAKRQPWRGAERRSFRRISLAMPAFCHMGEQTIEGSSHDLGAGGVTIKTDSGLPASSPVAVEVRPTPVRNLVMGGIVRRCTPVAKDDFRLGVEFADREEEDCFKLGRFAGTVRRGGPLSERRRFVRLRTSLAVDLRYLPLPVWQRGRVADLSLGGMMFVAEHVVHPDTELEFELDLGVGNTARMEGVVLDCHRDHAGQAWPVRVVFVNIPPEQRTLLEGYISSGFSTHHSV